jgi:hypothetical protein
VSLGKIPEGSAPLAGYLVGKLAGNRIPHIQDLALTADGHKSFGAAMAASGAVSMYSFSAPGRPERVDLAGIEESISISWEDIRRASESLRGDDDWDLVAIGCPHCSEHELRRMAQYLKGRKPAGDARVWFCTSRAVRRRCPREVATLKRFGQVLCDTCMVVAPIEKLFRRTASDSGKAMVYLPTLGKQRASFRSTNALLEAISR